MGSFQISKWRTSGSLSPPGEVNSPEYRVARAPMKSPKAFGSGAFGLTAPGDGGASVAHCGVLYTETIGVMSRLARPSMIRSAREKS